MPSGPSVVCRSCGGHDMFVALPMGEMPLANSLISATRLEEPEPKYPIDLVMCKSCAQVQISQTVPPETLFRHYLYFSSFSSTMLSHAQDIAEQAAKERGLGPDSLVVEIASNDGYLLKNFIKMGIPVLGIEPALNISKAAQEKGIRTIPEFFCEALAKRLAAQGELADVILANNVMAHIPDITGVLAGIKILLKPGGVFIMETPYVKDLIDYLEFDTIYHEHVFYHSLTSLEGLYRRHGLATRKVEHLPIHGGTLRVTVAHEGSEGVPTRKVEHLPIHGGTLRVTVAHEGSEGDGRAVRDWLAAESAWARDEEYYRGFAGKVSAFGVELTALLRTLKSQGKKIAGYGAAAKASTLINFLGLDGRTIDFVADRSTHKQGLFMPGSRIPVYPPDRIQSERPDYLIILAWNFADEIMAQQTEFRAGGGRFIVPLPRLRVV